MMGVEKFLVVIFSILIMVKSQQTDDDVPETGDCYDQMIRSNPSLKNRFSDDMLKQNCRKSQTWKSQSSDTLGRSVKPLLTPAQLDWATNIWKCKDIKCLCEMFEFCKNFLKQVGGLSNGLFNGAGGAAGTAGANPFKIPGLDKVSGKTKGRKKRQNDDVLALLSDKVGKANRKEIRTMSNGERNRFFRALNTLKFEKIDNMGKYDILITYHTPEYSPEAHFCASFLPFHRELLKSLEMALRVVEPDAALPYWDTTLDEGLPDPKDSILWTDEFLGNGNGDVVTGPFANWTTIPDARIKPLSNNLRIVRGLGKAPFGSLMKENDLDKLWSKNQFRDFAYCVDPFTELIHGSTHMWVGGHMLELRISPNDPSFFVFHSFVDYIWEQWRQQKQDRQRRATEYVSDQDACNQFCRGGESMKPFPIKIQDALSNSYTDQLYTYEPRPICSAQNPSCSSPYLFCDTRRYRCLSKIKPNGNCNGFDGKDICYNSRCSGGVCVPTPLAPPPAPVVTQPPRPPLFTLAPAPVQIPTTIKRPSFFTFVPPKPTQPSVIVDIVTAAPAKPFSARFPASSNTVWTPITVLSVAGRNAQPYPQAKIVSNDVDHSAQFFGRIADPNQVPYYSGSAFAQILNPFAVNEQVEATVDVYDAQDRKCVSLCINEKLIYAPCVAKIHLYTDSSKSDSVAYTPNVDLARFLSWNGNKRTPDKFLFLCSPGPSSGNQLPHITNPSIVAAPIQRFPEAPKPPATSPPEVTVTPVHLTTSQASLTFQGGSDSKPDVDGDEIVVRIITVNDMRTQKANGGCQNEHRCCPIWALVGECKRNAWMQDACQKHCGVCNSGLDTTAAVKCVDNDPFCETWAKNGECKQNAEWMEENCRSSCRVCDRSLDQLKKLCGGKPTSVNGCQNFNEKCKDWADSLECKRNPWWMKENCALSCRAC